MQELFHAAGVYSIQYLVSYRGTQLIIPGTWCDFGRLVAEHNIPDPTTWA